MKKTIFVILALVLISSTAANAQPKNKKSCIQKDFPTSEALKADTKEHKVNGITTSYTYYKINAGDSDFWLWPRRFARYVFKLEYQLNGNKLVITEGVPKATNFALDNHNPGDNESFSKNERGIKIEDYTTKINMDGTAEVTIKWSYSAKDDNNFIEGDDGISVIKINGKSSEVVKASGHCYTPAEYSGLQKIGILSTDK